MLQPVELRMDLLIHTLIAVADTYCDYASEEIQVLVAIGVPDVLIFGVRNHERRLVVVKNGREQVLAIGKNHFFFGHRNRIRQVAGERRGKKAVREIDEGYGQFGGEIVFRLSSSRTCSEGTERQFPHLRSGLDGRCGVRRVKSASQSWVISAQAKAEQTDG